MRLLSVLLGAGLAGAGLAAPVAVPYQVITTEDGAPLIRTRVARIDDASPVVPAHLSGRISSYVSAVLEPLRQTEFNMEMIPVFAIDKESVEVMTDSNGDLVALSYTQRLRALVWNPSTRAFYLYPMPGLRGRLPVAILAVSFWVLFTCLYFSGPSQGTQDPALEEQGLIRGPYPREKEESVGETSQPLSSTHSRDEGSHLL
ncbi:hypothetical protein CDD83_3236 [Cordyceps sp. RAO-2017]|nr:hypothetical protein CDD83_3236 [Cordyceps sp. RAO-2017]